MMPLGLSEQIIATGLPWREVQRMARRLAGRIPSSGLLAEDDLAAVGLVAAWSSKRPFAAAKGAMIDEIRRELGRTGPGRKPRPVFQQEEVLSEGQVSYADRMCFDDWWESERDNSRRSSAMEVRWRVEHALVFLSEQERTLVENGGEKLDHRAAILSRVRAERN